MIQRFAPIQRFALWLACLIGSMTGSLVNLHADQHVVVVLDDSGSMKESMRTPKGRVRRIDAAKRALEQVLNNLTPNTQIGVLALNTQVRGSNWIVPLGSADPSRWRDSLSKINAVGGTLLGENIRQGADELLKQRAVHRYGTYRLLVVTDGEANDGQVLSAVLPDVLSRGLLLDVIGVDMASDHSLAARAHSYRRADDEASLAQAIADVFAETSSTGQNSDADFDMLSALPEEFAVEGLKALAQSTSNEPIGQGETQPSEPGSSPVNTPVSPASDSIGSILLSLACCLGLFMILIFLLFLLAIVVFGRHRIKR